MMYLVNLKEGTVWRLKDYFDFEEYKDCVFINAESGYEALYTACKKYSEEDMHYIRKVLTECKD